MDRVELLELSQKVDTLGIVCRIDSLVVARGHEVLCVPLYHCNFSPNELIWSWAKRKIAGFTLVEAEQLLPVALVSESQENCQTAVLVYSMWRLRHGNMTWL